jgi:hypothetical protein
MLRSSIAAIIALAVTTSAAQAGSDTRIWNDRGQSVGTVSNPSTGGQRVFRDDRGRTVGTSSREGGTTVYRDSGGRTVGRSR